MGRNKKIKRIRKLPEGNNIVLIWIMLLLQAGESNKSGGIYLTDTLPFTVEDLAIEFEFDIDVIRLALAVLEKYSMIEIYDEIIFVKNWEEYQSEDKLAAIREKTRLRVQKYREKSKQLTSCNVTPSLHVTVCNAVEQDTDLEKENNNTHKCNSNDKLLQKKENKVVVSCSGDKAILFYKNNFNPNITEFIAETLIDYCNNLEDELIIEALKITKLQEKPFKYACGILDNCIIQGIVTKKQFDSNNKKFKNKDKDISKMYREV
jgi:predicted phage replisome organizer